MKSFLRKAENKKLLFDKIISEYEIEIRIDELCELEWIMSGSEEVMELLTEIPSKIRLYFDNDVDLALRVYQDNIEDSDYSIGVIVKTDKSVSDALRCFDLFEYYWWLEASLGVDVPIIINTEYI